MMPLLVTAGQVGDAPRLQRWCGDAGCCRTVRRAGLLLLKAAWGSRRRFKKKQEGARRLTECCPAWRKIEAAEPGDTATQQRDVASV